MVALKEWSIAAAKAVQAKVDAANADTEAENKRAQEMARENGEALPKLKPMPKTTTLPQFHYHGDRIFEVKTEEGEGRDDVIDAIAEYCRLNKKAVVKAPSKSRNTAW